MEATEGATNDTVASLRRSVGGHACVGASEGKDRGGGGSSEWSTSRKDEEKTEGPRNDAVVMLSPLSISRHACVGASESEVETTEGASNEAVVVSLRRLVRGALMTTLAGFESLGKRSFRLCAADFYT